MSLKDRIGAKAPSLVRRKVIDLPMLGEKIQVRGLMFGETQRIAGLTGEKRGYVSVALTSEDPETGRAVWNANSADDHVAIAALPTTDVALIVETANELSGDGVTPTQRLRDSVAAYLEFVHEDDRERVGREMEGIIRSAQMMPGTEGNASVVSASSPTTLSGSASAEGPSPS